MSFTQGQIVSLKSNPEITGAVVAVISCEPEWKYQVFTTQGLQEYYESQITSYDLKKTFNFVDVSRFHANLTANLLNSPSLSSLYSLNTAKIDFIPHQFRPVLKFLHSDRPRLLIADGVGVGKTIEAGLILKELRARQDLDSVLIICPRPLVAERKWEVEMKRFGEEFTALDGDKLRYCIKQLEMEGEWPEKYKKAIIPYSLFDEENLVGREAAKRPGLLSVEIPKFDLVIVDEAHHIRNTETYAHRAVDLFCDAAEAAVFLTATPVQLQEDDLFTLLSLLRPDIIIDRNAFYEMSEPNTYINEAVRIMRTQPEEWEKGALEQLIKACSTAWGQRAFLENPVMMHLLSRLKDGDISQEERVRMITETESLHTFSNIINRTRRRDIGEFTLRKAVTVEVPFTENQKILYDEILEVIHDIFSVIHCTDNTKFMMTTIRRQLASCLFGLVPMLEGVLNKHIGELIDDENFFDSSIFEDDKNSESIKSRIEKIIELAKKLPADDPKYDRLKEIVERKTREPKKKIMIFSSFRHTLNYLKNRLQEDGYRVGLIHGDIKDEERRTLRDRFNPEITPDSDPGAIDILLFSEVGCEGLDYQFCDCMVNYDLPWNPMRVEQRIGRIDRNGQTSESVSIYNMVTPGTVDYEIYERCHMRIGVFKSAIGDCEEVLGEITSEIGKITSNFELSEEDVAAKLQQMMDNKVRAIQEKEDLEVKQKDLFGIDLPKDAFDEKLDNATNYWLSGECVCNLVSNYLKERLGEKEYILGEKDVKTLRLSQQARLLLLEDYRNLKLSRNEINRKWEKWLTSGNTHLSVTFDSKCMNENPEIQLISVTHPLVKQASAFYRGERNNIAHFKVASNEFSPGNYPFAVYEWKLIGEKTDIQIVPISSYKALNKELLKLLSIASEGEEIIDGNTINWSNIEGEHHIEWEKALEEHKQNAEDMIAYKEASIKSYHEARMEGLKRQYEKIKRNSDAKPFAVSMAEAKIRKADMEYQERMKKLEETKIKADVLFEPVAYGVLTIIPEDK